MGVDWALLVFVADCLLLIWICGVFLLLDWGWVMVLSVVGFTGLTCVLVLGDNIGFEFDILWGLVVVSVFASIYDFNCLGFVYLLFVEGLVLGLGVLFGFVFIYLFYKVNSSGVFASFVLYTFTIRTWVGVA